MQEIQVISEISEFKALESEWRSLEKTSRRSTPFGSFDWNEASWHACPADWTRLVFVARESGAAKAIAPLVYNPSHRLPRLRMLSYPEGDPKAFLYADEESLAAVCSRITDFGIPVLLLRFNADAAELRLFDTIARGKGMNILRPNMFQSSRVLLDTDWSKIEAGMSSSSRKFMQRRCKIAEREGPVNFIVVSPDESNVDNYIDEFFRLEGSGWKAAAGSSIYSSPWKTRFYTDYGRAAARAGLLKLFVLRIGDSIAAVRFNVEYAGRLWELKIGYDERFSKCSPGILSMHYTLQYGCDNGITAYEFLGDAESWHRRWPIELCHYSNVLFYPRSVGGMMLFGLDACRAIAGRAGRMIRAKTDQAKNENSV